MGTRIAYLSSGGIQDFHRELAASVGAESFDLNYIRLPFALRYFKIINVPLALLKVPGGCDVYVCEGFWDLFVAWLKTLIHPRSKIAMLYTFPLGMEYPGIPLIKKLALPLARFLAKKIDLAFTCSEMMRARIAPLSRCPVIVVYPYAREAFFAARANLENNDFVDVSRDTPEKGLANLKAAFRGLPFRLDIVDRFAKPRAEGNIRYAGYTEDLVGFVSGHAFFAHLPNLDPFNIAVLEAMAAGVIPLTNRACGVSEVLEKNGLSELVLASNASAPAKIRELAALPPEKRAELSGKVRAAARTLTREAALEAFRSAFAGIA